MGRAGGKKKVEGNGNLQKKIVTNYACYCSTTMVTSKITKETRENLFQLDFDKPQVTYDVVTEKDTFAPTRCPSLESSLGQCTDLRRPCLSLSTVTVSLHYRVPAKMSAPDSHMR